MSLTLKFISAVSQTTAPLLSQEIIGAVGLLSLVIQRMTTPSLEKKGSQPNK